MIVIFQTDNPYQQFKHELSDVPRRGEIVDLHYQGEYEVESVEWTLETATYVTVYLTRRST